MSEEEHSLHRAGRGFLWLTAAKLHFILAGWAIFFVLPRLMDEVDWGRFVVVLFLVSILNNVMVSAAVQGVSRFTAASAGTAPGAVAEAVPAWAVLRRGLGLFLILGALGTAILGLGAPLIARANSDPGLGPLYQVVAPIVLCYALYAACVGSLNGRQRFGAQAAFDAGYATLRLGLMVLGALMVGQALAAKGAHAGFASAALSICVLGLLLVALPLWRRAKSARRGRGENGDSRDPTPGAASLTPVTWTPLLLFVLPLAAHQLGVNLLMRADPLLLKALGGRVVAEAGALSDATSVADATSVLAGHYATAQVFALVPYQALVALSMVVFPLVADAAAANRREALAATAAGALRFALLFGAGCAAVLSARPADIIDVVYPEAYRAGGVALRFLAWGALGLSLISLAAAMLNAAGRTLRVLAITFGTFGLQALAVVTVLHLVSDPQAALRLTAMSAAAVLLTGGLVALLVVRHTFGVPLPWGTLMRVVFSATLATCGGAYLPGRGALVTMVASVLVMAAYLALLWLTRELTRSDLDRIRRVLRRQGARAAGD